MSKQCARCDKTVYPIEELKCLDKVWHKGCFKCQECGMTLSMKTYKGFNKLPYCEAHIPKAKATTVAETPEMKRLAENTKIQSNVQYHADFEKNKAKFTQVADDPETMRIKQNSKIISNVSYHGDLEKKAIMEKKRSDEAGYEEEEPVMNSPNEDQQSYSLQQLNTNVQPAVQQSHYRPPQQMHQNQNQQPGLHMHHPHSVQQSSQPYPRGMGQPYTHPANSQAYYQQQPPSQYTNNQMYQYQLSNYYNNLQPANNAAGYNNLHHNVPQQNLYQDANHNSPYSANSRNSQTLIYSSQTGPVQNAPTKNIGSIADYDPMNDQYGSISQKKNISQSGHRQEINYQVQRGNMYPDSSGGPRDSQLRIQHKVNAPPTQIGRCYKAMYDYEAADMDEVSFRDGDFLINCTSIDEGWMTGTVQRTGKTGMLPANYVERVS